VDASNARLEMLGAWPTLRCAEHGQRCDLTRCESCSERLWEAQCWDEIRHAMRPDNDDEPPDRTHPWGGFYEDGSPHGPHPYYDYGPRPTWLLWELLYRKILLPIQKRHVVSYWTHITNKPGGAGYERVAAATLVGA
jgi:hypothetical protein